jgi:hypothetical protein
MLLTPAQHVQSGPVSGHISIALGVVESTWIMQRIQTTSKFDVEGISFLGEQQVAGCEAH